MRGNQGEGTSGREPGEGTSGREPGGGNLELELEGRTHSSQTERVKDQAKKPRRENKEEGIKREGCSKGWGTRAWDHEGEGKGLVERNEMRRHPSFLTQVFGHFRWEFEIARYISPHFNLGVK